MMMTMVIAGYQVVGDHDDADDDLYIIGAVCVCVSQKSLFLYSRDFVVSPVYRHFPYSRYFVISPVYRHHILKSV